jgi:hypothetical protein
MAKKTVLRIIDTNREVAAKILFEVVEQIDKKMRVAAPKINLLTGELIEKKLMATPHVRSLLAGQLMADFGLSPERASSSVEELISAVKASVKVKLNIKNRGKLGDLAWSMSVTILPEGLSDVLRNIGSYSSNGNEIIWMDWLLTKGVSVIYDDFFVVYSERFKGTSRSGFSLMFPSGGSGRIFRVDPAFAGTIEDNFVVNTLESLLPEIANLMFSYLQ